MFRAPPASTHDRPEHLKRIGTRQNISSPIRNDIIKIQPRGPTPTAKTWPFVGGGFPRRASKEPRVRGFPVHAGGLFPWASEHSSPPASAEDRQCRQQFGICESLMKWGTEPAITTGRPCPRLVPGACPRRGHRSTGAVPFSVPQTGDIARLLFLATECRNGRPAIESPVPRSCIQARVTYAPTGDPPRCRFWFAQILGLPRCRSAQNV